MSTAESSAERAGFSRALVVGLALPSLIAVTCAYLYVQHLDVIKVLAREDGPFEWLTAIFYFAAAGLFVASLAGVRIGRLWLLSKLTSA